MADDADGRRIESRFMTLKDVAVYLSVSEAQVYALVRSGNLPAIKIGGRGVWRVDREKLEEYIERTTEDTRQWVRQHPWTGHERRDLEDQWRDEGGL